MCFPEKTLSVKILRKNKLPAESRLYKFESMTRGHDLTHFRECILNLDSKIKILNL